MALSKEDLKSRLESLVEDAKSIEGLAVADAARVEGAVIAAYSTIRSLLDTPTPPVQEVSDPAFEQVAQQSQAVGDGGHPNVHPLTGEPVPPGSTEGVRPDGTVQADAGVPPVQDPSRRTGDPETPEPALNPGDPVRSKDEFETQQLDPALAGADNPNDLVPESKPGDGAAA